MRRIAAFVAAIALTLAGIDAAVGTSPLPPGYAAAETTTIHPGVHYQRIAKPRPVLAHVARIEPGAAVDLRVVSGRDKVPNRFADLETTGSMCRRVQCVVAVNGDFHYAEQPVGGVVTGGRMIRSPDPSRPQFTIETSGRMSAGGLPWTGRLIFSNGVRVPLAGINVPPRDGVVLYTTDWGTETAAPGRVEVVIGTPTPAGVLNETTPAHIQNRRVSPGPIPTGGAVLSASGSAAEALDAAWRDLQQKAISARAQLVVESPVRAAESLGVNPVVLRDGSRALPWPPDPNVITALQPRTLVGWNDAGERFIVAVDGRQPSSAGLTMAEAADFLLGLGATDAVNLDGGGGTTFVVGGSLRNRPSDHADQEPPPERVAPNALVVLARPKSSTRPASPLRPMTVDGPAESRTGPSGSPAGDESPASGGPADPGTWSDQDQHGAGGLDPAEGVAPEGEDQAFRVGALIGAARHGGAVPGIAPPSGTGASKARAGPPGGASAEQDGSGSDQIARALPVEAAAGIRALASRSSSVTGHVATWVAVTLLVVQSAFLLAVARRRTVLAGHVGSIRNHTEPLGRRDFLAKSIRLHWPPSAPLAQTAEHFHGKEGVYGSIP